MGKGVLYSSYLVAVTSGFHNNSNKVKTLQKRKKAKNKIVLDLLLALYK
jgi:hypothetical protein